MGALLITVLRGALYFLALLANIAASIVLVRRLPPQGYALYQTVSKRVSQLVAWMPGLYLLWAYRAAALGDPDAASAALAATVLPAAAGGALGFLVARDLGAPLGVSLLAAASTAAMILWAVPRSLLDASRPVRAAAAVLARRLVYSLLVVALVYLASLGLLGAFAASLAGTLAATMLGLLWLRERGLLRRPSRRSLALLASWARRSYATALGSIAAAVGSLDVGLAYPLAGSMVVAGFFAVTVFYTLSVEAVLSSLQYLHGYVLSTGRKEAAVEATRLALLVSSPIAVYTAVHPSHVVALFNPRYLWAAPAATAAAAAALLHVAAVGVQQLAAGAIREDEHAARRMARLQAAPLLAALLYLGALMASLLLAPNETWAAAAWGLCLAARWALVLILVALLALGPVERRLLAQGLSRGLLYVAAAAAAALLLPPRGAPQPRFWAEVRVLAPWWLAATLLYAALVLAADPWARSVASRALARLRLR